MLTITKIQSHGDISVGTNLGVLTYKQNLGSIAGGRMGWLIPRHSFLDQEYLYQ